MVFDIGSLLNQEPLGRLTTAIGEVNVFRISYEDQRNLHRLFDKDIKKIAPIEFTKKFALFTCYPINVLKENKYKPDKAMLNEDDVDKWTHDNFEVFARLYIENNKHLFKERLSIRNRNGKGDIVVSFAYGDIITPKKVNESCIEYLYRLFVLELEEQKKQSDKMKETILGTYGFSKKIYDDINNNSFLNNSLHNALLSSNIPKLDLLESFKQPLIVDYRLQEIENMTRRYNEIKSALSVDVSAIEDYRIRFERDISAIASVFKPISTLSSTYIDSISNNFSSLHTIEDNARSSIERYSNSHILPSNRLINSLANIAASYSVPNVSRSVCDYALSNLFAFQDFAQKQLQRIASDQQLIAQRRIQVTDKLGKMYEYNDVTLGLYSCVNVEDDYTDSDIIINPNIYNSINTHIGYVYNPNNIINVEVAIDKAMPTKINRDGCRMIELVYLINDVSKKRTNIEVFTPTNKCIKACL